MREAYSFFPWAYRSTFKVSYLNGFLNRIQRTCAKNVSVSKNFKRQKMGLGEKRQPRRESKVRILIREMVHTPKAEKRKEINPWELFVIPKLLVDLHRKVRVKLTAKKKDVANVERSHRVSVAGSIRAVKTWKGPKGLVMHYSSAADHQEILNVMPILSNISTGKLTNMA